MLPKVKRLAKPQDVGQKFSCDFPTWQRMGQVQAKGVGNFPSLLLRTWRPLAAESLYRMPFGLLAVSGEYSLSSSFTKKVFRGVIYKSSAHHDIMATAPHALVSIWHDF